MTIKEVKEKLAEDIKTFRNLENEDYARGNVSGVLYALYLLNKVEDHTTTCLHCGKDFTPNDPFHQKFCSMECKKAYKKAEEPVKEQRKEQTVPEGYKLNPAFIEKKERRVQLVFQSSLYEKAKAKQKQLGYKSLNAYICSLLEADTDKCYRLTEKGAKYLEKQFNVWIVRGEWI